MGRRHINTTKSGKYMNPTDQARKEARKKELKKNKKQRQLVRTQVLKGKDPRLLLMEMEQIDEMEYNITEPSPLNEKVLKEKRRKLRETFDRVMRLYHKEDFEKWKELKMAESEYEKKRIRMLTYSEAVKSTHEVNIEEIPLPSEMSVLKPGILSSYPFSNDTTPSGILKKSSNFGLKLKSNLKTCPGVPPGPPPALSDEEIDDKNDSESNGDSDYESDSKLKTETKKIRFADEEDGHSSDSGEEMKKYKAKSGQSTGDDIDAFMREIEAVHKAKSKDEPIPLSEGSKLPPAPPMGMIPPMMFGPPPPMMMRMPPGPPPGRPPHMEMGLQPPFPLPLARMMQEKSLAKTPNVVSAAPQLVHQQQAEEKKRSKATIEAKAQIKNLNAQVTRFMPTSVKLRQNDSKHASKLESSITDMSEKQVPQYMLAPPPIPVAPVTTALPTKDDAYVLFMKEMKGLL